MKPKPTEIFREEVTHPDPKMAKYNSVRTTYDRKRYELWVRGEQNHPIRGRVVTFHEGTITWKE